MLFNRQGIATLILKEGPGVGTYAKTHFASLSGAQYMAPLRYVGTQEEAIGNGICDLPPVT